MRWRGLWVVVLLAGCERAAPPAGVSAPEPTAPGGSRASVAAAPPESQEPPPSSPESPGEAALILPVWSARSATGHAEVRQVVVRDVKGSHCASTALVDTPEGAPSVVWKWDTCLATQTQVPFVSEDGKRVLVLDPSPLLPRGDWKQAEVAVLYEHGVRMRVVRAGSVFAVPHLLKEPVPRMTWVRGLAGLPGAPPRYSADGGAVELETEAGRTWNWSFSGEGFPPGTDDVRSFSAAAGMYRYEDEHKTMHFVGSLDEVPAALRGRAVRVESQVAVVKSPPLPQVPQGPARASPPALPGLARASPAAPTTAALATPAELLQRTRETVKQANASQHELQRQLEAVHEDSAPVTPRTVE